MSTALAHRTFDVLRGDADAIRLIGSDPRATDQSFSLMLLVVLAATLGASVRDPLDWALDAFIVAAAGLLFSSASMWLIGKAFDGSGRFIALLRLAGFTAVPLALGLASNSGLVVGAVWSFALATRVIRALHVEQLQVAVVTAVLPSMLVISMVFAVTVDVAA